MSNDHAFAEFASARWSALYRLSVLLVGETAAEDLTQAALLKIFLSWDRVVRADSIDAYVRKVLVNTAISDGRKRSRRLRPVRETASTASHETELVERSDLLGRVDLLPPRQRAVIVLRYYEDLSEAEIARTLGCATGTVKAHASAGLRSLRVSLTDAVPEILQAETGGRHD